MPGVSDTVAAVIIAETGAELTSEPTSSSGASATGLPTSSYVVVFRASATMFSFAPHPDVQRFVS
jgi:hypothetical protein